jgi:peptidoglycan hydrolase-like protein with peptidoglycan-binding domain
VTGTWNAQTATALKAFQARVHHPVRARASASDLVSLLSAGNSATVLRRGAHGPDVTRVQRALNAAGTPHLTVTGTYNRATALAVGAYQRRVGVTATRVVAARTWAALVAGRR